MEAFRKIVSVDMLSPIVSLPWKRDMQVEVIIMPIEEQIVSFEYSTAPKTTKLSDKFRGVFSKEAGESFMEHTKKMREEWENI
jgi:hypothetical protein